MKRVLRGRADSIIAASPLRCAPPDRGEIKRSASSPRGASMSASSLNGPFATNQTFHDGDAPAARAPPARTHALSMLCSLAAAAVLNRGTAQFGRRNMRQDMVGPSVALDCRSFAGATRLRH